MEQIPKKYLKASNAVAALQKMRDWLQKGLRPSMAVRQILEAYKSARTNRQKQYLGKLLYAFAETVDNDLADYCSHRFQLDPSDCSLKGGIPLFVNECKQLTEVKWNKNFAAYLEEYKLYDDIVKAELFDKLFFRDISTNVVTLHQYDKIFAVGDEDSKSLDLIIANDSETLFFTHNTLDSNTFTFDLADDFLPSPVYKIVLVKRILEFILSEIGFPFFPIKTKVVFHAASEGYYISLSNQEIFESSERYKDVEFILPDDLKTDNFFTASSDLLVEKESDSGILKELKHTLLIALKVTAVIYRKLLYSSPDLTHTTTVFRKLAKYVFNDVIVSEKGLHNSAWLDNTFNVDCPDEAYKTCDKLSDIHDDGYPSYLLFYKDNEEEDEEINEEDNEEEEDISEEIDRRFKVNSHSSELTAISDLPELFRSGIWNEKVIVIPGYVASENNSDCEVEYMYIEPPHPPLPFVEVLLVPKSLSYLSLEDKKSIFPSLRQIIFYEPGYLKREYSPADIEEHGQVDSIPLEMHRYTLEYLFRDWDPEDWPDGYYSEDEPYDAVFTNMTFKYNSVPQTAELVSVPPALKGRLIVPETIPIPLNCIGSRQMHDHIGPIRDNTVINIPVKKVSLDDESNIEELVIPFDCDILFSVEGNPNIKAIFFK